VIEAGEAKPEAAASVAPRDLELPPGAILLHIGPHKTGTTTIQHALHVARPTLAAHDAIYAGTRQHSAQAARAASGLNMRKGVDGWQAWQELVEMARAAPTSRVVFSSEWFSQASPGSIKRIVRDLGAERVHVVVTLRPLAAILPSQWQQHVQVAEHRPYEVWLHQTLDKGPDLKALFWRRHSHDALIARWIEVVGSDRVIVVVADPGRSRYLLEVFEGLLGLPPESLPFHRERSNRSLTWPEVEVVRHINIAFRRARLERTFHKDLILFGVARAILSRRPGPEEPRIETPGWALERATEIATTIAQGLTASGARFVGDPASLRTTPAAGAALGDVDPAVWTEITALAVEGVLRRTGAIRLPASDGATSRIAPMRRRNQGTSAVRRLWQRGMARIARLVAGSRWR
jgi:hypothetical protein